MRKYLRDLRWRIAVPVLRVISVFIAFLSRRQLIALGQAIGFLTHWLSDRERTRARKHLAMAFPVWSEVVVNKVARQVFDNLAIGMLEALVQHSWSRKELNDLIINFTELQRLIEVSREGAVLITGHIGNWELLAAACARNGGVLQVVGRRMREEDLDDFLTKLRGASGLTVLYTDASPREMLRALRSGVSIGMLPDQDITEIEGVFVNFFARPANTPSAPAKLAMLAKVPVYVAFLVREGEKFRMLLEGPITPVKVGAGEREAEILRVTNSWTRCLENAIRAYPEQWVWMHQRWRNTPERLARRKTAS